MLKLCLGKGDEYLEDLQMLHLHPQMRPHVALLSCPRSESAVHQGRGQGSQDLTLLTPSLKAIQEVWKTPFAHAAVHTLACIQRKYTRRLFIECFF